MASLDGERPELVSAYVQLEKEIEEHERHKEMLRESQGKRRVLWLQLLTSQEQERKRIASELHDGIGSSLSAIKFRMEHVLKVLDGDVSEAVLEMLGGIVMKIRDTSEEVRRVAMDLRPSTLDDLGILATIDWLCREFQGTCPDTEIIKHMECREDDIPDNLKIVIYRVIQEALNNVARHSNASRVYLDLAATMGQIILRVSDSGHGFSSEEYMHRKNGCAGIGLQNMRERAELSGGEFSIESKSGSGTTIAVFWPSRDICLGSD